MCREIEMWAGNTEYQDPAFHVSAAHEATDLPLHANLRENEIRLFTPFLFGLDAILKDSRDLVPAFVFKLFFFWNFKHVKIPLHTLHTRGAESTRLRAR